MNIKGPIREPSLVRTRPSRRDTDTVSWNPQTATPSTSEYPASGRPSGLSPQPALTDRAHGSLPLNVPYLPDFIPGLASYESISAVTFALA